MLGKRDLEFLDENFKVYDHNWRFYSKFLGEPYLIKDCLVYFDSKIVYVCAFSLCSTLETIDINVIISAIDSDSRFDAAESIDVWGNFSIDLEFVHWKNSTIRIIKHIKKSPDIFDSVMDVELFSYDNNKKARLARNAVNNKNLISEISCRRSLSTAHINLMDKFVNTHKISFPHISFFLSLQEQLSFDCSCLIEAYSENKSLIGFALLMFPAKNVAVYTLACYDNQNSRAADCTMVKIIDICKKRKIKYLHLGYSTSASLLEFKNKWGAKDTGIKYEEYFLSLGDQISIWENIMDGTFLWKDRLFSIIKSGVKLTE